MSRRKKKSDKKQAITDYKNFVIDPINIGFGKLSILSDAKLVINYGVHYGLVGKNGIGKTSLLNAISDRSINVPIRLDLIHVKQEEPESDNSVLETLLASDEKLYSQSQRLNNLEKLIADPEISDEIIEEYNSLSEQLGSSHLKAKAFAQKILFGLGFDNIAQNRRITDFSGGWRMRIALAKALFITPTLLILDEPTNHLDLHANLWFTQYAKTYPKTLLVVSHDKYFIDEVCTTIIHINRQKLTYYQGSYDKFEHQLTLENNKIQKDWLAWKKNVVRMKRAHKTADEISEASKHIIIPEKNYQVRINFLQPAIIKGAFVRFDSIGFGYDSHLIYANLNLSISSTSRMAIVGRNGIGKSTLLKLIIGDLQLVSGEIIRSSIMRIGYYNQHFENSMPFDINPVTYLLSLNQSIDLTLAHKYLSMFGLPPGNHKTLIGSLSGGQKARVKLASFGIMKPHLLILDEPTNHLDMVTINSLISALDNFTGAIVLVTHNFDIITKIKAELWIVDETGITRYPKNYDDYIQHILQEYDT